MDEIRAPSPLPSPGPATTTRSFGLYPMFTSNDHAPYFNSSHAYRRVRAREGQVHYYRVRFRTDELNNSN